MESPVRPVVLRCSDDSSSSDENSPVVKKPNPARKRRGLASRLKLQSTENSAELAAQETAIYSTQVSKCFCSTSGSIPLQPDLIKPVSNDSDVEEDNNEVLISKSKRTSSRRKSPRKVCTLEDEDDCVDDVIPCTPPNALNTSLGTIKSPSPPPQPPSPPKEIGHVENVAAKKPRMSKAVKKALSNLSQTKNQLHVNMFCEFLDTSCDTSDVICLDDDTEDDKLTLKIKHGTITHRIPVLKNELFKKIIADLSKKLNVQESQVLLIHNDNTVLCEDTPNSLGLTTADILHCHINTDKWIETAADLNDSLDDSHITLYIQSINNKHKMEFKVNKMLPLDTLVRKYALKTETDPSKVKLKFDGELLDLRDSADSLELEDGFTIDVIHRK